MHSEYVELEWFLIGEMIGEIVIELVDGKGSFKFLD